MLILSASIGMSAFRYIEKAKYLSAKNQIEVFCDALNAYYMDCGVYPTKEQGLNALWKKTTISPIPKNWNGPYVQKIIKDDPWNNSYVYKTENEFGLPFIIFSYGADGLKGGEGNNQDIESWN